MGEESVHQQDVTNIVVGIDGHRYKPLSLQEAKSLCCDIPFYLEVGNGTEFDTSSITPEVYRIRGNGRLDSWYASPTSDSYYVRVDTSKPEYTPEESNL